MIAFVFPGQGSQKVGMGVELAEASTAAREVFQEVDDSLNQKLAQLMAEGPESELTMTANAQPAIMANAIAVARVLEAGGFSLSEKGGCVAGHSLGEYSALAAVGAFSLSDTARLLRTRGIAMQDAVPIGLGAMCALLGADLEKAQALADAAAQGQVCEVANDNDPAQVVLSGHMEAIDRAVELAKEHGIKRAIKLPVSAPFHCSLMQPAALCQCHRRRSDRSRHRERPAGGADHGPCTLARKRAGDGGGWCHAFHRTGRQGAGPDDQENRARCEGYQRGEHGRY